MNDIHAKIVELSAYKSAYNHYLASYHAALHPEITTIIKQNKTIVNTNLIQLYKHLYNINYEKHPAKPPKQPQQYHYSNKEIKAIQLFNKDNRYTITE